MFGKKRKLHDGYILSLPLKDRLIHFYRDSPYNRVMREEVFKVDEDKVIAYEDMCQTYRENFIELGLLRLHTPLDIHEEQLGTYFLYVPPKERARIAAMLKGKPLVTSYSPDGSKVFCVVEKERKRAQTALQEELKKLPRAYRVTIRGTSEELATLGLPVAVRMIKCFTLDELIGSGEIVNPPEIREQIIEQNREKLQRSIINEEEIDKQVQAIVEDKFSTVSLEVEGMFIQRKKTWLDKIALRG